MSEQNEERELSPPKRKSVPRSLSILRLREEVEKLTANVALLERVVARLVRASHTRKL